MKELSELSVEDWQAMGVEWQEDGSAIITLSYPIQIGHLKAASLTMQCPDLNQAEEIDKSPAKESALSKEKKDIAGLMGLAPEEMGQIKFPDYRRVQKVYSVFFTGTPPLYIGGASAPQSASSPAITASR